MSYLKPKNLNILSDHEKNRESRVEYGLEMTHFVFCTSLSQCVLYSVFIVLTIDCVIYLPKAPSVLSNARVFVLKCIMYSDICAKVT